MADSLDLLIARGPPPVNFSPIGDLPRDYWEGQDQAQKQKLRDAFKAGIPLGDDGAPYRGVDGCCAMMNRRASRRASHS
jgi:hypothetical protein